MRMRLLPLTATLLTVWLTATQCSSDKSAATTQVLATTDFDQVDGLLGDAVPGSLNKEKAHSGRYSIMVRPGLDYSLSFNKELSQLSPVRPHKLRISAWVLLSSNDAATTSLVTEIRDPSTPENKQTFWEGMPLGDQVKKADEWQHIEKVITLGPNIGPNNRLAVYLWRNSAGAPAYLDDLEISLAND